MPPRDRTKRRAVPRQARARASVDAILTAAEQVIAEHGFAKATTNRIAARAGVNVALLYRYFAGKEAIVGALIDRAAQATEDAVRAALDPEAPLPELVRAVIVAAVTTPGASSLHRELVEQLDAARRREVVEALRARIAAAFAAAIAGRKLRKLADPAATMFVLQHAIEAASHAAAFYRPADVSLDRAIDALTDLVVRTLAP